MSETTLYDAEIRRRYSQGQSTNAIAKALGLRLSHVIGRVRALSLPPPGNMSRAVPAQAGVARERDADPPSPLPPHDSRRPRPAAPKTGIEKTGIEKTGTEWPDPTCGDDRDDEEPARRKGCPRGWLVTEEQFVRSFHRSRGRFEDVAMRQRPGTGGRSPAVPGIRSAHMQGG